MFGHIHITLHVDALTLTAIISDQESSAATMNYISPWKDHLYHKIIDNDHSKILRWQS